MREKTIEQKFRAAVKAAGGVAVKFISPGFDGVPDRLALLPGGRMAFVEVKAKGKKPRPLQLSRHRLLRRLGFKVYVLDDESQIGGIIEIIKMKHIYRKRLFDEGYNNQALIWMQEKDLPGDLRLALDDEEEDLYGIFQEGELVGIAMVCEGGPGFISIYIKPDYRHQGIASFILAECEKQLREQGTNQIMTAYTKEAASFAQKRGYLRQFSSAYMIYTGDKMKIEEDAAFVRQYRDEDYDTVHAFHAKAFHEMRLQVGDFPDSREEEPSEEMRQEWARAAEERLVYVKGPAIVGYAHMEGCELDGISVDPVWQGKGMGRRFLKCVCNHMIDQGNTEIKLFCVIGNPARKPYDSIGFKEVVINEYAMKTLRA